MDTNKIYNFGEIVLCPKCGQNMKYMDGSWSQYKEKKLVVDEDKFDHKTHCYEEYLKVKCLMCGFSWKEHTFDHDRNPSTEL